MSRQMTKTVGGIALKRLLGKRWFATFYGFNVVFAPVEGYRSGKTIAWRWHNHLNPKHPEIGSGKTLPGCAWTLTDAVLQAHQQCATAYVKACADAHRKAQGVAA